MNVDESAFVARILAGMTHELLNLFAIIKESAGLVEDLLALSPDPAQPWHDKAERSFGRIRNQVRRGTELSQQLNRFAHGLDEPMAKVELNQLVDQLAYLMQRFARNRRVTLCSEPALSAPAITTSPLQLQLVLAACIDHCLESTAAGGTVTLRVTEREATIAIRVEIGPEPAHVPTGIPAELAEAFGELKASVVPLQAPAGLELVLDPRS